MAPLAPYWGLRLCSNVLNLPLACGGSREYRCLWLVVVDEGRKEEEGGDGCFCIVVDFTGESALVSLACWNSKSWSFSSFTSLDLLG